MRDIKFKLYLQHEDTGNITSVIFTYADIFSGKAKETLDTEYKRWYVIAMCQYTGLQDKNGKEIFEGDKVKSPEYSNTMVVEYTEIHESDGMTAPGIGYQFNTYPSMMEIIGNIYENPELIK